MTTFIALALIAITFLLTVFVIEHNELKKVKSDKESAEAMCGFLSDENVEYESKIHHLEKENTLLTNTLASATKLSLHSTNALITLNLLLDRKNDKELSNQFISLAGSLPPDFLGKFFYQMQRGYIFLVCLFKDNWFLRNDSSNTWKRIPTALAVNWIQSGNTELSKELIAASYESAKIYDKAISDMICNTSDKDGLQS